MNDERDPIRLAPLAKWLAMPLERSAEDVIERIRRADDVVRVAVMPDVHLAGDVCVGTAMATRRLIFPAAVGGDIGCGMLAFAMDAEADLLRAASTAGSLLRALGEAIPAQRRHRSRTLPLPTGLDPANLSHPWLRSTASDEGSLQLGTLGSGNHFIELQADEESRLWIMIHSGSRAMGQAVRSHHLARATIQTASLSALDADTADGQAYLNDQQWASQYARVNREAMGRAVVEALKTLCRIEPVESLRIHIDHNHVRREEHFVEHVYVHRKGAMSADAGEPGVIPGSMGTLSFHVEGRGCAEALRSSAHGAGRLLSRHAACEQFGRADLRQQMRGVWFDPRLGAALREESPRAYKDVRAVLRAQRELVKITRTLRPLLVYKGR